MIYNEDGSMILNPDDMPLSCLGVITEGDFYADGTPTGWHLDIDGLDRDMPRWLAKEPVLFAADNGPDVYVRGLHSRRLSAKRAKAMIHGRLARSEESSQ